jgi:transposase
MEDKSNVVFEQVIERGCGIDVHKKIIVATVQGVGIKTETREYQSFTEDLEHMAQWLKSLGISHIAMESTGVYWKPLYNVLEQDFEIVLVNAAHMKNVPGRKTDRKDSNWIAKLLLSGLLKGSFIPPKAIRELRDLTRYRRKLIDSIASEKNRIHKLLEDANIKLSSVVSDLSGSTSCKIIEALVSGIEDVEMLSKFRHGKMQCSESDLQKALKGFMNNHHRFLLKTIRKSIQRIEETIKELDEQIDKYVKEATLELDIELLSSIPGVGKEGAKELIAELGSDMSKFPNQKHIASWAGMSPGNNESAGKKKSGRTTQGNNNVKTLLVQFGWAATRTKGTYLRSKYDSLVGRRGKKRALVAIGHKILIAAYYILKDKVKYKDLGGEFLQNRRADKQVEHHIKKLKELGVEIQLGAAS